MSDLYLLRPWASDKTPVLVFTGRQLDAAVKGWTDTEILERLGRAPLDDDHDVPPGDAA